jgi:hypothetical protein
MSDDPCVETAAIRQVVQGHEIAVLAALGIDWRPG